MGEVLKPTVLIDMDGVLADFDGRVQEIISERHPYIAVSAERTNFYIAEDYPEHIERIREISREAGFFASLGVIDGAKEGWQRILALGYHPRICTSPIKTNPHSGPEKIEWLKREFVPEFGVQVAEEAIVTSDKYQANGIALIDDRPKLPKSEEADWQHIIFDRPYNQGIGSPRLRGWHDPELENVLNQARILHRSFGKIILAE